MTKECWKCEGTEPDWGFGLCDAHQTCCDCGTHRSELTDTPWGVREGFRCAPCQDARNERRKNEALDRVAAQEYDPGAYEYTTELLCPHCGTDQCHEACDGEPGENQTCDTCGGEFSIETHYSIDYSTAVIGDRITA